jgi:hypothetical protein
VIDQTAAEPMPSLRRTSLDVGARMPVAKLAPPATLLSEGYMEQSNDVNKSAVDRVTLAVLLSNGQTMSSKQTSQACIIV